VNYTARKRGERGILQEKGDLSYRGPKKNTVTKIGTEPIFFNLVGETIILEKSAFPGRKRGKVKHLHLHTKEREKKDSRRGLLHCASILNPPSVGQSGAMSH